MKRCRFQFAAVMTLGVMALLGCNGTSNESQTPMDFPYTKLETADDVQRAVDVATSKPNAILLVHVNWAPMVHQRTRFAEFKRDYQLKHPASDLEFHCIDCTPVTSGYEPLRNLDGWQLLEEENNGTSLVHEYGELVWCKDARVLHVERPLNFESTDALIVKTESLGMASVAK